MIPRCMFTIEIIDEIHDLRDSGLTLTEIAHIVECSR